MVILLEFLLDISTGEFLTSQGDINHVSKLLQNFRPSEVLISNKSAFGLIKILALNFMIFI